MGVVHPIGCVARPRGRRARDWSASAKFREDLQPEILKKKEKFRQKREKMAKKGKKFNFPDLLCKNPYDLQPE